jgi:hypothetical protein
MLSLISAYGSMLRTEGRNQGTVSLTTFLEYEYTMLR